MSLVFRCRIMNCLRFYLQPSTYFDDLGVRMATKFLHKRVSLQIPVPNQVIVIQPQFLYSIIINQSTVLIVYPEHSTRKCLQGSRIDYFPIPCDCVWAHYFRCSLYKDGARGSVVGWDTMLQAGRSRDRIPMRWIFWIYLFLPAALWPWVWLSL
jgi:hypothetical protein